MRAAHFTLSLLIPALFTSAALADVSDNFDNTAQAKNGWTIVGDAGSTLTYFPTGGNPTGFLQLADAAQGADDYFVAPAPYLGSKSQYLGGTLSFDLMIQFTAQPPDNDILLTNGSTTLSYLFPTQPAVGVWTHFNIPISTTDPNWHLGTFNGAAPALSDFKNVLANLTKIEILGDYRTGTESNDLDNVLLHSSAQVGDANLDGKVDLTDLSTVLNNFGTTTPKWTDGNFDGAATIDLTDLSDVLNNFGFNGAAPATAGTSLPTPEPASLPFLVSATLPLLAKRSRRQ